MRNINDLPGGYRILGKELGTSCGSLRNSDQCYGYLNPSTTMRKLSDYFGYSEDMDCIYRAWYIGSWKDAIKDEIVAGRPVLYWALEDNPLIGAHTFVCDGYEADNDLFHFNWGHGDEGTWVSIDNIVEDYHRHWTRYESAMIKIKPAVQLDICDINLPFEVFYNAYYMYHIQDYNSNSLLSPAPFKLTPKTMTTLTSASSTSRPEFRTIPFYATAKYRAHEEIVLQDGFMVERGAEFTAQIVPCANCGDYRAAPPTIVGNMEGDAAEPIPETSAGPSAKTDRSMTPPDQVYPNPTDGEVTVHADGEVQGIVIYNMQGLPVGGWKLLTMTSGRVTLDVSPLSAGTYLVRVATPQAVVSRKVVKN